MADYVTQTLPDVKLTENERKRVMFACILPNLFFGCVPDGCFYYCILPQGAKKPNLGQP